jgi:hypothetical protein
VHAPPFGNDETHALLLQYDSGPQSASTEHPEPHLPPEHAPLRHVSGEVQFDPSGSPQ